MSECLMEFFKVTLTFESVDQILWWDHSNKSSLPVLTHGAICFSKFHKMKFGRNLPLAKFGSAERIKGAKVHRADLESGSLHIGLVFILYGIAFRVGRTRNEPTMKTATQVTKCTHASLRKVMRSQERICTTWPISPFICRLRFIISSPKLVTSCNFLSIRIVLSCFYLLIF